MYNGAEPPEVSWVIWRFPPSSMSAGPGRDFLCAQCGKAFTRRAYLKRHQRAHQPMSGSLQCSICQKRFSRDRRSDLVLHCRRVHHQEAMESVYEAISPGSPLRDEQAVLPDDLLRQAAQQLLGAQQMEQQQPLQLTPLLNPALVVRAAPGAGAALHRQLQVTPSRAGVGVSLSVYGRLDQGDVMMQAHKRPSRWPVCGGQCRDTRGRGRGCTYHDRQLGLSIRGHVRFSHNYGLNVSICDILTCRTLKSVFLYAFIIRICTYMQITIGSFYCGIWYRTPLSVLWAFKCTYPQYLHKQRYFMQLWTVIN